MIIIGFHVGLSLLHGCACAFLGEIIEIIEMMEQREQKPLSAMAESSRLDYAESRLLTTVKSRGRRQPNE